MCLKLKCLWSDDVIRSRSSSEAEAHQKQGFHQKRYHHQKLHLIRKFKLKIQSSCFSFQPYLRRTKNWKGGINGHLDSTEHLSFVNRVDKVQVYNHYLHYSVFVYATRQDNSSACRIVPSRWEWIWSWSFKGLHPNQAKDYWWMIKGTQTTL